MRWMILGAVLGSVILIAAPSVSARLDAKAKVTKQADLPRFSYTIVGTASQFVEADDAQFKPFAAKVRADIDRILADFEIEDKSTMRKLLAAKLDLQELDGDYEAGLRTVEALRALEEKPSSKLTSGLFARARLQAALDTRRHERCCVRAGVSRVSYRKSIDALPWDVVQDQIKSSFAYSRINSRAAALGEVKTELDPAVSKSGALDNLEAWELISARINLKSAIPLGPERGDVLHEYIALHDVVKPEIWSAREATLTADQHLTPVLVGIWDSGIDVSLFPNQLFTDPNPTASGTHGLAFDDVGNPSTDWLYPLTAEQQKAYPEFRDAAQGDPRPAERHRFAGRRGGAEEIPHALAGPDARHDGAEQGHRLLHPRHALRRHRGARQSGGAARRRALQRSAAGSAVCADGGMGAALGAAFQQMGDYFRTRHVRVVNMSWGDDAEEFETWLSKTGGGADPEQRKKRAAALFAIWREAIANAIKSAPDTLFVTAAGNSDSNVGFIEDVPPSLHLPNLIAVGAVNQAGDETSFTSHGDTVLVHANGYWVDSFVPGGARLKLSGTSMAAPNVVNLAAKLFALDPSLTPAQVIALIQQGATTTADGRRHLIDENRSIALLKARN